jgi:hypothetical protein
VRKLRAPDAVLMKAAAEAHFDQPHRFAEHDRPRNHRVSREMALRGRMVRAQRRKSVH